MKSLYSNTANTTEFSLSEFSPSDFSLSAFIGNRSAYANIMRAKKEKATSVEAASENLSDAQH